MELYIYSSTEINYDLDAIILTLSISRLYYIITPLHVKRKYCAFYKVHILFIYYYHLLFIQQLELLVTLLIKLVPVKHISILQNQKNIVKNSWTRHLP